MLYDYFKIWGILYRIDYPTFLEITGFTDDYFGQDKWKMYITDYTVALLSFDSNIQGKFNAYINEQVVSEVLDR